MKNVAAKSVRARSIHIAATLAPREAEKRSGEKGQRAQNDQAQRRILIDEGRGAQQRLHQRRTHQRAKDRSAPA